MGGGDADGCGESTESRGGASDAHGESPGGVVTADRGGRPRRRVQQVFGHADGGGKPARPSLVAVTVLYCRPHLPLLPPPPPPPPRWRRQRRRRRRRCRLQQAHFRAAVRALTAGERVQAEPTPSLHGESSESGESALLWLLISEDSTEEATEQRAETKSYLC